MPIKSQADNVPIKDANTVALQLVNEAGPDGGGGAQLHPARGAEVILQAAQKLGLENRVKAWACSTPCNTDFLAKALGPQVAQQAVHQRRADPDRRYHGPEMQLYEAILKKYGAASVTGGVGSFSQMGFLDAEMAVKALQKVKGAYTLKSVNEALKGINDYKTEMLCKPFTYGNYSEHIPNNTDYTVTPSANGGTMVVAQGCTPISSADPQIAALPQDRRARRDQALLRGRIGPWWSRSPGAAATAGRACRVPPGAPASRDRPLAFDRYCRIRVDHTHAPRTRTRQAQLGRRPGHRPPAARRA